MAIYIISLILRNIIIYFNFTAKKKVSGKSGPHVNSSFFVVVDDDFFIFIIFFNYYILLPGIINTV